VGATLLAEIDNGEKGERGKISPKHQKGGIDLYISPRIAYKEWKIELFAT